MLPTNLNTLAVIIVVCAVAAGGIAASTGGTFDVAVDGDGLQAMTGGSAVGPADSDPPADRNARQQTDDPVEVEPGETVTGDIKNQSGFVFDIGAGERATIEFTLEEPVNSSMVYQSEISFEMPDGRIVPNDEMGYYVSSGETRTFNVTATETGQAEIRIYSEPRAEGAFELSLDIEQVEPNDEPVEIEPGETVTGDLQNQSGVVFDIEPGETATLEYTWEESESSGESSTAIEVEMPDGRTVPERSDPPRLIVDSGETATLNVTTKKAGQAKVNIITDIDHSARVARGTFELSLRIEQTGEIPDEPNDDRANATVLELNTTKSAELDFGEADVDHYTFTLPEYETPDEARQMQVPVTVTLDREDQRGITALNVDTAPAGQPSDTTTRYVGTDNPASVQFVGTEGEQYYVAVVDVNEGGGPYNLTVQVDDSNVTAKPVTPGNATRTLDEISQAAYGLPFSELSEPTSQLVRAVHDRQDDETKLSKDELAQMRYDMSFEELSEETKEEITVLYRAQFVDGQG